ncbi:hypothetical protein GCM10009551_062140 [Nocardiopsis tropica]
MTLRAADFGTFEVPVEQGRGRRPRPPGAGGAARIARTRHRSGGGGPAGDLSARTCLARTCFPFPRPPPRGRPRSWRPSEAAVIAGRALLPEV